ncbi:Coenzyme F420 hydrogenase/dehydrogenase, beta subunit C-terminal domain [Methanocella arvoryzae]|uniref:Formate dehydrogenase, beta subunit n=1 Tax=Methanocella arvoryzae (strain DSM 22066 / NBRC 105507 / MRE50) TaxID=351160 RepID=Q0W0V1_METAR|nr:formate dehydrogenase, beta subunit [Methanocella arvoryzae MRE50]
MVTKGELLYTQATDKAVQERGETGGTVTALLKYLLESHMVDAVYAMKKGADIYDAQPTLITDPKDVIQTAGSLHCGTLLVPKQLSKTVLNADPNLKIAVVAKGCDTMALYEMAKRGQINLDNILMIGVNCGGTVRPAMARKMIREKFGVNPDTVVKEEIDKGQFIILTADGQHKGISIDELEEQGYGRRENCRRCKTKIPRQADLACGNWGIVGDKAGKATFVEVCSDKGAQALNKAVEAGVIEVSAAPQKGVEIRGKVEQAMLKLADKWRAKDFAKGGNGTERLQAIMKETSRCIRCYACIENCPICYCTECSTKKPYLVTPGEVPPNFMFHMIRFMHVSDSCINCGQCEELCPMDIENSRLMHSIQADLEAMFGYKPGVDMTLPVLALVKEPEERERLAATGTDQIFNIFKD